MSGVGVGSYIVQVRAGWGEGGVHRQGRHRLMWGWSGNEQVRRLHSVTESEEYRVVVETSTKVPPRVGVRKRSRGLACLDRSRPWKQS